jgi:thiamine phosphate synthase YjbQ (UPF0047 family)
VLKQVATTLVVDTRRRGLVEITPRVREWVAAQSVGDGVLTSTAAARIGARSRWR